MSYGLPVLVVLLAWWLSTGIVLYLHGLPRWTFRWSMTGATLLAVLGIVVVVTTRDSATVGGAYLGFLGALAVWAWLEMSFFMGWLTGPKDPECDAACAGMRHFLHGIGVVLYHELAVIAAGLGAVWLLWDAANPVALWTFSVLWLMRWSAKLNMFLGVRNVPVEFFPDHLASLANFIGQRPWNYLFPFSVTMGTLIWAWVLAAGLTSPPGTHSAVALMLTATLLGLGVLEHWFLVLPLPVERLWQWGMTSRRIGLNRGVAENSCVSAR